MKSTIELKDHIIDSMNGWRLDQSLAKLFPKYSREQLKAWIKQGAVQVNGNIIKQPRFKVHGSEYVIVQAQPTEQCRWEAQAIALDVVFEDEHILIINKPAGLVVHPGAGNPDQTLVNALLHHAECLKQLPRAGIVHRLDKDTTGLLVIAKNLAAHFFLVNAMQAREIARHYYALVHGNIIAGSTIDEPIGRHSSNRTKMAITSSGKEAITHYRVEERFTNYTLLDVQLETGRTHQIRVHLNHINHPIVGDLTYKRGHTIPGSASEPLKAALQNLKRQALHAHQLSLPHPDSKEIMTFSAPIPDDMQTLINVLTKARQHENH